MKKILILIYFLPLTTFSQFWFEVYPHTTTYNFESTENYDYLTFDTIPNQINIWQIAKPSKPILDTTIYANQTNFNVIITDSLNPYPINDTSSFTIKIPIPSYATDFFLEGSYYIDSDSLNDYGKIEYSMDNGVNWVLISDDTLTYTNQNDPPDTSSWPIYYNHPPIVLTGLSNEWKSFHINLIESYQLFNHNTDQSWLDTALYRFTFISDQTFDDRDGLMFDNINIVNVFAFNIHENKSSSIKIYPNPLTSNVINFANKDVNQVKLFNSNGKLVFEQNSATIKELTIPNLAKGIYIIHAITTEDKVLTTKLIVE